MNAKKQRKIIEWERLEISSRKLEIAKEHAQMGTIKDMSCTDGHNKGHIMHRWAQ